MILERLLTLYTIRDYLKKDFSAFFCALFYLDRIEAILNKINAPTNKL
jgi:hypothetical protein